MTLNAASVKEIYGGKTGKRYDLSMPHSFKTWKRKAINQSNLKQGDTVLVFCCGSGLDFPYIEKVIGTNGKIIGIDFSKLMLDQAHNRIKLNNWNNVELIQADATSFNNKLSIKADVGICTLGLSIIPDYLSAYYSLLSNIKEGGQIIIGDMQLAEGWLSYLNPITIAMSRHYGGSYVGHQNSLNLIKLMKDELINVQKGEFFFKSYYFCLGTKAK